MNTPYEALKVLVEALDAQQKMYDESQRILSDPSTTNESRKAVLQASWKAGDSMRAAVKQAREVLASPNPAQNLFTLLADWIEYEADLWEVPLPEEFQQHGDTEAELRVALGVVFRQWARGEPLPFHYGGEHLQEINQIITGKLSRA